MGVSNLEGTPWHVERMHREEGDERRHKKRCKHYSQKDNFCTHNILRCKGSAHCDSYVQMSDSAFKKMQTIKTVSKKVSGDDDVYWY